MTLTYRNVTEALPALATHLISTGEEVGSRLGERVIEQLHQHIVLTHPTEREVLTTGRRAKLPAQIAETMWVLAGRNDVEWLSNYLPRAADFSDDGKTWRGGYGPRIRSHQGVGSTWVTDQLRKVVDLLAADPTTRRAVIQIFDAGLDWMGDTKDVPCNDMLVFTSRFGRLDLSVHTRSNDLIWGWSGVNQFEWSALQEIVAGLLGIKVGELHFNIVSLHAYDRHWQTMRGYQAPSTARLAEPSPAFSGSVVHNAPVEPMHPVDALDELVRDWFRIEEALRLGTSDEERRLACERILSFPEPMLQSWLWVLAWWWGAAQLPAYLEKTALAAAMDESGVRPSVKKTTPTAPLPTETVDEFVQFVSDLHAEKHAAYGDSWKKRGEQVSILANIARKVDRLGGADTSDETSTDTAIDLLVYLVKYRLWLAEQGATLPHPLTTPLPFWDQGSLTDIPEYVSIVLGSMPERITLAPKTEIELLKSGFENLYRGIDNHLDWKAGLVASLIRRANLLARALWAADRASVSSAVELFDDKTHEDGPVGEVAPDYGNPYRNIDVTDVADPKDRF